VILIEHNTEVIRSSDWIIDLGPEGGALGGQVVAQGTPAELIKSQKGATAKYL
jgi:excinuclease ABC subunit A